MAVKAQGSWTGIVVLVALAWMIGRCSGSLDPSNEASRYAAPMPTPFVEKIATTSAALTDVRYVAASSLNLRAEPNGAVVGRVTGGDRVEVKEARSGWLAVTSGGREGWVSERHTCRSQGCWTPPAAAAAPSEPRRLQQAYGSSCPCSGSANCYGPRGGRYCITSGGNKRYR